MTHDEPRHPTPDSEPRDERMDAGGVDPSDPSTQEEPVCAICGERIAPDDITCPHCGASLVAG